MYKVLIGSALLMSMVMPVVALAAETPRPFTMDANAAYLKSTGSSNKETIKGLLDLQYKNAAWTHQFHSDGLNEANNDTGEHTTERYLAFEKSSWNFTERDYLFVKPQWEKDLQSAYVYQALLAAGYGRNVIKSESMLLNIDLGAGMRHSKFYLTRANKDEAIGNVALKYEWKFSKSARFNEDLSAEAGDSGAVARTRTALTADITDVLGLTLAYETRTDSGDSKVEDSLTTFGLNYRLR
jgi:putative salt-induced outer membrane protein